jgi:hypothetical protein
MSAESEAAFQKFEQDTERYRRALLGPRRSLDSEALLALRHHTDAMAKQTEDVNRRLDEFAAIRPSGSACQLSFAAIGDGQNLHTRGCDARAAPRGLDNACRSTAPHSAYLVYTLEKPNLLLISNCGSFPTGLVTSAAGLRSLTYSRTIRDDQNQL